MTYVDAFMAAVKRTDRDAYRAMAETMGRVFLDHGALHVVENFADDVPHGTLTDFHMAVKCEDGEVPVFSWILWPSQAARDAGMKAVFEDDRMDAAMPMPFDRQRIIFGGFETIVDMTP